MKVLRNIMEDVVKLRIEEYGKSKDICRCDDCKMDMMAIMLNLLKPCYVISEKGELFSQLHDFDPQYQVNVLVALTEAVNRVRDHPRHNGEN